MLPEANEAFGMSDIINLDERRRARDVAPPDKVVTDHIISRELNDYASVHFIMHERREVVQAGIDFLRHHVEAFGPGGWGEFNGPREQGGFYVASGLTVRFPDEMFNPVAPHV